MVAKLFAVFVFALLASAVSLTPTDEKEPDSPLRRQKRIVGGSLTTIDQYPFTAAVLYQSSGNIFLVCGGSILNTRSILTAASCFPPDGNPDNYFVRVGSSLYLTGGSVSNVQQFVSNPGYNPITFDGNMGIIKLSTRITLSATAKAAQLPSARIAIPVNSYVFALGWGSNKPCGIDPAQTLRRVALQVAARGSCLASAQIGGSANFLCALAPLITVAGPVVGDTGGPLVYNGMVVAVTNINRLCLPLRNLNILDNYYTRVDTNLEFIRSNM